MLRPHARGKVYNRRSGHIRPGSPGTAVAGADSPAADMADTEGDIDPGPDIRQVGTADTANTADTADTAAVVVPVAVAGTAAAAVAVVVGIAVEWG